MLLAEHRIVFAGKRTAGSLAKLLSGKSSIQYVNCAYLIISIFWYVCPY